MHQRPRRSTQQLARAMVPRFGVTRQFFHEMAVLALALAAVMATFSMIALWLGDAGLMTALGFSLLLGIFVVSVVAAAFALVSAFSIHVTERSVQQRLWSRFVMSEYPLVDFVDANAEQGVLHFLSRRRLRLVGMHRDEIIRLAEYIRARQIDVATRPNTSFQRTHEG